MNSSISLRDYFAGQIASSILTNATGIDSFSKEERAKMWETAAVIAYEFADALVEAKYK